MKIYVLKVVKRYYPEFDLVITYDEPNVEYFQSMNSLLEYMVEEMWYCQDGFLDFDYFFTKKGFVSKRLYKKSDFIQDLFKCICKAEYKITEALVK